MTIEYLSDGRKFGLDYSDLKESYNEFVALSDEDFKKRINEALHLACFICFVKGVPTYNCLNDTGIIHELIHLLDGNSTTTSLKDIRDDFKKVLMLS